MNDKRLIIFTDLDGTLLDHNTYSYQEAVPALDKIKKESIPLILASSKTKNEMRSLQSELSIDSFPFIVENGSAVYSPFKLKNTEIRYKETGDLYCYQLGKLVSEIRDTLQKISVKYGYKIKGFHNSDKKEIIRRTNLSESQVKYAMDREFTIPLFYDKNSEEILLNEVKNFNLQITYGGRFIHLTGLSDKGRALKLIKSEYRNYRTVALGDTLNDQKMLEAADIPVLIKRYNDQFDERVKIKNILKPEGIGPAGWNKAILHILNNGELNE